MDYGKENVGRFDILFDSDGFVALFVEQDAHHEKAKFLFQSAVENRLNIVASDYIVAETATVLSRLSGQEVARKFLSFVGGDTFPIIQMDTARVRNTLDLFHAQPNKRTSVFDCSNVIIMQEFQIPMIFSFDHFYKRFDFETADKVLI